MIDVVAAQGGGPPLLVQMAPFVLIAAAMYFLLIHPQRRREREHRTMLANLKRNDEVITSGGLHGRIVGLTDAVLTLEVASNVRVRVERAQIASRVTGAKSGGEGKERARERA